MSTIQYLDWSQVETIVRGARLSFLFGPPGTGKTTAAVNAARALKLSVYSITLTDETPAAELRGHFVPVGGEFRWMDGPAFSAYRNGGMLILNEIDKASLDALDFCNGLLDDPGIAQVTLPSGEIVFPHDDFRVCCTSNVDPENLPESLQERLCNAMFIATPHPEAIASLPDDLQTLANNAIGKDSDPKRPITMRRLKTYAQLRDTPGVGNDAAMLAVFAHRATEVTDALAMAEAR